MLVIIGAVGHGKNTLAKAIEKLTDLKCEVLNTNDLIEISKEQAGLKAEDLAFDTKERNCENKETKTWKKTKFYQR